MYHQNHEMNFPTSSSMPIGNFQRPNPHPSFLSNNFGLSTPPHFYLPPARNSNSEFLYDELRPKSPQTGTGDDSTTLAFVQEHSRTSGQLRRPIFIDGENLGRQHARSGNNEVSCKGILIAIKWFLYRGHKVKVLIPRPFLNAASQENQWCFDGHVLEELVGLDLVEVTSSNGRQKKEASQDHLTRIVYSAHSTGGCIVSCRQFRDIVNDYPLFKKTTTERLLMPTFLGDEIHFPVDGPMGKFGKNLDQTLRAEPGDSDEQRMTDEQLFRDKQIELLLEIDLLLDQCTGKTNSRLRMHESHSVTNGVVARGAVSRNIDQGLPRSFMGVSEYGMDHKDIIRKNQSAPCSLDEEDLKFFMSSPSPSGSVASFPPTPQPPAQFPLTAENSAEGSESSDHSDYVYDEMNFFQNCILAPKHRPQDLTGQEQGSGYFPPPARPAATQLERKRKDVGSEYLVDAKSSRGSVESFSLENTYESIAGAGSDTGDSEYLFSPKAK